MAQQDKGQIILYQAQDGENKIEVTLANDTVWLTTDQMAELFQRNKSTISRHIKNIFEDGELKESPTVAFFATVGREGNRNVERELAYYNLDMIISVGYRVKSHRGVQFRIWATQVLKEYLIKGFVLNDELLKNAGNGKRVGHPKPHCEFLSEVCRAAGKEPHTNVYEGLDTEVGRFSQTIGQRTFDTRRNHFC